MPGRARLQGTSPQTGCSAHRLQPLVLVLVGAHPLPPATDLSDPYLTFSYPWTGAAVPLPADGFSINSSPNGRAFRFHVLSCFSFIGASYSG